MTVTCKSQTKIDGYYFLTINDETDLACDCTCADRLYRGRQCKHMKAFNREVARAATFQRLVAQFDVRSESVKATKREQYREFEFQCGSYSIPGLY